MTTPPHHPTSPTPPPLTRNLISFAGWMISGAVGAILVILMVMDFLFHQDNPYNSLVTYLILPGVLMGGVGLIFLGAGVEWLRRHRHDPTAYPRLPIVNLNLQWQRRRVLYATIFLVVLFTVSAIGVYRAYHFTESPMFCGRVCHQVMEPEYTAYQHSPHARVACAQCHIGPGAGWFVKSKLSGLHQVWAVALHTYKLPIPTPVHNLRPAQQTCEQCHWPVKFMNSVEKVIWHFSPDQSNTPTRYNLLLKIGGGSSELGQGRGIHWHTNPNVTVRYWARDEQRLDIPWVEVRHGEETPRVFRAADCPDPLPQDAQIRTMDCIDCHNRPSHIYRSPLQLIDTAMAHGLLDRSLPFLKRYATELYERIYTSTPEALKTIAEQFETRYEPWMSGPRGRQLVQQNIDWLQQLYQENFFPEQGVSWRVYPDHRGHFEFPGCVRCHDEAHKSTDGRTISYDCNLCHDFLDQAEGEAAFAPPRYVGGPFRHPRNMGDIWKGRHCTDCHGVNGEAAREEVMSRLNAVAK